MLEHVITWIEELIRTAREKYGVNPVVFVTIYLVCTPIFYYSLFRMARALSKKLGKEIMLWSAVFLCTNVAPFVYVIFFGRNIPWWVYGILAILIGQVVFSLAMKLRSKPAAAKGKEN